MKLKVDADLCSGHSRCWKFAPDVFVLDEEGFNVARGGTIDVPAHLEREAKLGRKACPERAIIVTED